MKRSSAGRLRLAGRAAALVIVPALALFIWQIILPQYAWPAGIKGPSACHATDSNTDAATESRSEQPLLDRTDASRPCNSAANASPSLREEASPPTAGGEDNSANEFMLSTAERPPQAPLDFATATAAPEPKTAGEVPFPQAPTALNPPLAPAASLVPAATPRVAGASSISLSALEQELYNLQNSQRAKAGQSGLRLDPTLTAIARQRATDMATRNYFSHSSPRGESAFTLLAAYGYSSRLSGENLARNNYPDQQSASTAMAAFMNSAGHRENLLDPSFTAVGVGSAYGAQGMKYFAVVFAEP